MSEENKQYKEFLKSLGSSTEPMSVSSRPDTRQNPSAGKATVESPPQKTFARPPAIPPAQTGKVKNASFGIHRFSYDGNALELFLLWFKTIFLTILTFGIYSFWGKTQIRKYLVGHLLLDGERFEYTGTGKELGYGFLKGLLIIALIGVPYFFIIGHKDISAIETIILIGLICAYVFVRYMSRYTATRYRLSRGTWRGIRGTLSGSAKKYAWLSLWHQFLNVITLGVMIPRSDVNLRRYIIQHSFIGNIPVKFADNKHSLMRTHLITALIAIPTLFLSRFWYRAALYRYLVRNTSIANVKLNTQVTGSDLLRFFSINFLIILFTLGLGSPLVRHRTMNFMTRHITLEGSFDDVTFMQAAQSKTTWGEGMVDVLNDASEGFL